jgi:REP element-mobilizing transposase RayT
VKQLALRLPHWGGKRRGAGRKPKGRRPLVSHRSRPRFERPAAVQVTLSVAGHVWNLRSRRCFEIIEACLAAARGRFGLRVIEFTVLGNHLHVIVEADNDEALSRGMLGLNVRIAKALNRLMDRTGRVFADHYHSRLLRSPTELVNAIAYVLGNAAHHYGESGQDRFSSRAYEPLHRHTILSHPRTWLLRSGWRRARTVPQWLAANGWPPPWAMEHLRGAPPHPIDAGAG